MRFFNERATTWQKITAVLIIIACGFLFGWEYGRKFSANPTIHQYEQPKIITVPGDAICPQNHYCTWKAWDEVDDKEVKREGR